MNARPVTVVRDEPEPPVGRGLARTGVTAIVTGLLFVLALFIAPVVGAIPAAATAPALIIVGSMMVSVVEEIAWHDPEVAIPAFLTMLTIPLTFSIANGLAFGFTAFSRALHPTLPLYVARVIACRVRRVPHRDPVARITSSFCLVGNDGEQHAFE